MGQRSAQQQAREVLEKANVCWPGTKLHKRSQGFRPSRENTM